MNDYDYESSGFDEFLSRPLYEAQSAPRSSQLAYDRSQITGSLGDIFKIGSITLDGVRGRITITEDDGSVVVILGELGD